MDRPAQKTAPGEYLLTGRNVLAADLWKSDSTDATDATPSASQAQLLRPRAGTVSANILTVLESGQGLTAGTAWRNYGCARLAAVAHDLKRMGYPVVAVTVEVTCTDGRIAHVASYSMGRAAP
jgi:hypothetical protein